VPMIEDMGVFFSPAEFATPATLDGAAVLGILDQPYAQLLDGVAGTDPVFVLPTQQVGNARQGSWLVVGQATYRVRSAQHDGTGVTTLVLESRP
jgi:hypothetical protein